MLRTLWFPLTGCSSDWQSAAFGTQKSLVQIQSPRLSLPSRGMRLMLVGGVVAAAFGGGATPSIAASVTARSGEIVAREAPGSDGARIGIIRGSDRVRQRRRVDVRARYMDHELDEVRVPADERAERSDRLDERSDQHGHYAHAQSKMFAASAAGSTDDSQAMRVIDHDPSPR